MVSNVINKSQFRKLVLAVAEAQGRGGRFTQVSSESYEWAESLLRNAVARRVQCHPSKGKTLDLGKQ